MKHLVRAFYVTLFNAFCWDRTCYEAIFLQHKTVHLVGKFLMTQNIKEGKTFHPDRKLLKTQNVLKGKGNIPPCREAH